MIPEPCNEPWDKMKPAAAGRYCGKCQKTVIDFSGFSDAELYKYFSTHNGCCGRFLTAQLNRTITIPYQPKSKLYRLAIACGFSLLFIPLAAPVYAQNSAIPTEQRTTDTGGKAKFPLAPIGKICGRLTNGSSQPVANAMVMALCDGKMVAFATTGPTGAYELFPLVTGTYELKTVHADYDTAYLHHVAVTNDSTISCNITVAAKQPVIAEIFTAGAAMMPPTVVCISDYPSVFVAYQTHTGKGHKKNYKARAKTAHIRKAHKRHAHRRHHR